MTIQPRQQEFEGAKRDGLCSTRLANAVADLRAAVNSRDYGFPIGGEVLDCPDTDIGALRAHARDVFMSEFYDQPPSKVMSR